MSRVNELNTSFQMFVPQTKILLRWRCYLHWAGDFGAVLSVMKACTVNVLIREVAIGESCLKANNH